MDLKTGFEIIEPYITGELWAKGPRFTVSTLNIIMIFFNPLLQLQFITISLTLLSCTKYFFSSTLIIVYQKCHYTDLKIIHSFSL